jgi:riboflavin transporter FmnP
MVHMCQQAGEASMNTRTITLLVTFTALTIVLNLSQLKFPAPYLPFLIYQVWEIPIVAAFLLFGTVIGVAISVMNTAVLLAVFPGDLPTGPFYNLAAVLSMLLGIGIAKVLLEKRSISNQFLAASVLTCSGLVFRTIAMGFLNYALLRYPPPVGFSLPEGAIVSYFPLVMFFNATLALYTIPAGFSISTAVKASLKLR